MSSPVLSHSELDSLSRQATAIRASGVLGKSGLTQRLFDYLVGCTQQGKSPKELDIAIDALGRGPDFDVAQDALVRVYIHKLRKKLDEFYAGPGREEDPRIAIPRGEYRLGLVPRALAVESVEPALPETRPAWQRWLLPGLAVSVLANLLLLANPFKPATAPDPLTAVRASALWAPLLDDALPIYIITGDYYIFGELDQYQNVKRLIRDFDVNSPMDFEYAAQLDPAFADKYHDLNLAYLPTSSAYALRDLMPVLSVAGDRVHVMMASQVTADLLKSGHVIYIGYFSGMGSLRQIVFAGSRLSTGSSFDELKDNTTGQSYLSDVGLERGQLKYRDYGYVATFPGTSGNQIVIVAGTRDIAVMRAAELVTRTESLSDIARAQPARSFEALYEVYGFGSTDLDARLILTAPRDPDTIWRNAPGAP
jgi:hypothetical protein